MMEVLALEIIEQIALNLDKGAISSFSRTSKPLQHLLKPVLYKEIEWRWDCEAKNLPPIHLLLRTLVLRPDLALLVKKIHFLGFKYRAACEKSPSSWNYSILVSCSPNLWSTENQPSFTDPEMRALTQLISTLDVPSEMLWLRAFERGEKLIR